MNARERAKQAAREADAAECLLWSEQMEGFGGPAQRSPTIAQCLNGGYGWLQVKCHRCETSASIPLDAIRRPRDTPIWKLEGSFRCRSCGTRRYKPPVHMIKLTEAWEITPYVWVHPDELITPGGSRSNIDDSDTFKALQMANSRAALTRFVPFSYF